MVAKLLTLSRILRESVPFSVALSDDECERSDAARSLERLAEALSAAGCARSAAYSSLDFALPGGVSAARAECARSAAALALARLRADNGLRAAAALMVAA